MELNSTVIKVKLGETLRRFNTVTEINFNMVMMREKICSLFDLPRDIDFTLTYIDEDGDIVTLSDDNDLEDIGYQCLNPLRITVKLNTKNPSNCSPQDQIPLQILYLTILEILKDVKEPLRDAIPKILQFLASEAESCKDSTMGSSESKEKDGSKIVEESKKIPATYMEALTLNLQKILDNDIDDEVGSEDLKKKNLQVEKMEKDDEFGDFQPPKLNFPYMGSKNFQPLIDRQISKAPYNYPYNYQSKTPYNYPYYYQPKTPYNYPYYYQSPQILTKNDDLKKNKGVVESSSSGVKQKSVAFNVFNAEYLKHFLQDSKKVDKKTDESSVIQNECESTNFSPFKKSYNDGNGYNNMFNYGVQCDGCGFPPLSGPHFKSKVKDNYHLCSFCFEEIGNETDYIKINHSMIACNSSPVDVVSDHSVSEPSLSRLDSCFVLDLNVHDGTMMAPSTPFTKIWRIKNNGNIVWPRGSKLMWTGGDLLSKSLEVEVEIPDEGLQVNRVLDVAVDFSAPEVPGQYVSYWRMASPSGQKFGQRVWVLINVDDGLNDSAEISVNSNPHTNPKEPEVVKSETGHIGELHENRFVGAVDPTVALCDALRYTNGKRKMA